jgi:hypothetical protein
VAGPRERSCWSWSADQIRLQQRSCEHNAVSLGEGMVRWSGATPDRPVVWDGCTGKARSRRERRTWQPVMPICRGRGGRSERAAKAVSSRAALWRKYWAPPFRSSSTEVPRARTSRSAPVGQQDLRHSATHQEPSGASLITIAGGMLIMPSSRNWGGRRRTQPAKAGRSNFLRDPRAFAFPFAMSTTAGQLRQPQTKALAPPSDCSRSVSAWSVSAMRATFTELSCSVAHEVGGGVHIASRGDALSAPP